MPRLKTEYYSILENFVNDFKDEYGKAPSIFEIEDGTGIPKSTAARYLKYMNDHNMLVYDGRRSIITKKDEMLKTASVSVPVLGYVSCGIPKYAEENIEEYVMLPESLFGKGEFFILYANGESMINAGIDNGDMVIIRKQDTAQPGQIIVALVDDENATLKRYRPLLSEGIVELIPENDEFNVQKVNLAEQSFAIQGIAVKVIKDLR